MFLCKHKLFFKKNYISFLEYRKKKKNKWMMNEDIIVDGDVWRSLHSYMYSVAKEIDDSANGDFFVAIICNLITMNRKSETLLLCEPAVIMKIIYIACRRYAIKYRMNQNDFVT